MGLNEWYSDEEELDYNSCLASINEDSVNERYEEIIMTFPEYIGGARNASEASQPLEVVREEEVSGNAD